MYNSKSEGDPRIGLMENAKDTSNSNEYDRRGKSF